MTAVNVIKFGTKNTVHKKTWYESETLKGGRKGQQTEFKLSKGQERVMNASKP